jgi:hypothetical protein
VHWRIKRKGWNVTQDFFMGQLRLIAVAIISYLTGTGRLSTADGSIIGAVGAPGLLLFGPWLWSIYRNVTMKLVPMNSIAIAASNVLNHATAVSSGTAVINSDSDKGEVPIVKVVGAILIAFTIMSLAWSNPVLAEPVLTGNPARDLARAVAPRATAAPSTSDASIASLNEGVQKIEKAIVDKGIADLTAAITDATNHKDNISLPCWKANLALLQSLPSQWETPPSPIGIALGIQIQRDLLTSITGNDETSIKVACAALWGDQLKIIANVGALIGIRIATGGLF